MHRGKEQRAYPLAASRCRRRPYFNLCGEFPLSTRKSRVRLEGFEPPTRDLGNRAGSFIIVFGRLKTRLYKPNSHKCGCSSFTVVSGGLVYWLV
jgi:hypothetical protein